MTVRTFAQERAAAKLDRISDYLYEQAQIDSAYGDCDVEAISHAFDVIDEAYRQVIGWYETGRGARLREAANA